VTLLVKAIAGDDCHIMVRQSARAPWMLPMPRKRSRSRLSVYSVSDKIEGTGPNARIVEHIDPNAQVEDHYLVRHAMVDFDELALLSRKAREQLVADLVGAIRYARCRQVPSEAAVSREVEKAYRATLQGRPYPNPTVRAAQMPLGVTVGKVGVSNQAVAQ